MLKEKCIGVFSLLFFLSLTALGQARTHSEVAFYNSPFISTGEIAAAFVLDADEGDPVLAKKYFLKGKGFFDKGDYEKALIEFRKSLYEDPTNPVLNHLMGRAAYELGNYEEALFAYERVLSLNPNLVLSRLEKGRTHLALGSRNEARKEFKRVLEADIPQEVKMNVEALIAQLGSERQHTVNGVFLLSNLWDSNTTLGTGPLPLVIYTDFISDATARSDRTFSTAIVLNHSYPLAKEGLTWKNSSTVYFSDNTTINSNDLFLGILGTGLEYQFKRHQYNIMYSVTGINLDEKPYQVSNSLAVNYNYFFSNKLTLRAGWTYSRRHHYAPESGTNFGFIHGYSLGASYIQDKKNNWDLAWAHKYDKSPKNGPASSYRRYEITGRYTRTLTDRINFNLIGTRRHDEYNLPLVSGVAHLGHVGQLRSDMTLIASGGFTFMLNPQAYIDVLGSYTNNDSVHSSNYTYMVKQFVVTFTKLF
jgi:tetratricopeptide (TPR) repeat protein